jgi:hypothetical protein
MKRSANRLVVAATFVLAVGALSVGVWWMTRMSGDGDGTSAMGKREARFKWRSVRGRHWQIISTDFEDPAVTDKREGTRGDCPAGMVQVQGAMKLDPDPNPFSANRIETMQLETCVEWIAREYPERCKTFDRDAWLTMIDELSTKPMSFCIDRFEYPNIVGQYPIIYASWYEASEMCEQQGKRLCSDDEWTFACEGEEAKPYPYGTGYVRAPEMCITDELWRPYNEKAMLPRDGESAGLEMDRLWRGKRSGEQKSCRSDMGVFDMTGNVDEWTHTSRVGERPSILKGGYWGPVRTRCRPTTRSHDQNHMFYQQGFRCCADRGAAPGRAIAADPSDGPLPREVQ